MELELDDVVLEDALDALESVIQRRSVMESVRVSIEEGEMKKIKVLN